MTGLIRDFKFKDARLINFINLTAQEKGLTRGWRNNKNIRKWMYSDHIISHREHINFIKKIKKDKNNLYWLARNNKGEYLGVIYLNRVDLKNKNAYLGIYSNPYSGLSGTGLMLIGYLKKMAFNVVKLHTLKLEVLEDNHRAVRFYKNFGFKEEGRLKYFVLKDGAYKDVIIMGLVNNKIKRE